MRQIEPYHAPYGDPDLSRRLLPFAHENLRRDPHETSQLGEYLMILRHRWKIIAGFTAAGVVLMGIVSILSRPLYTAQAVLHIQNAPPAVTNILVSDRASSIEHPFHAAAGDDSCEGGRRSSIRVGEGSRRPPGLG